MTKITVAFAGMQVADPKCDLSYMLLGQRQCANRISNQNETTQLWDGVTGIRVNLMVDLGGRQA